MWEGERVYIVEGMAWGEVTVVVGDGSGVEVVASSRLPRPLRVGTRLRVPVGSDGRPLWAMAIHQGLAGYPELAAARQAAGLAG